MKPLESIQNHIMPSRFKKFERNVSFSSIWNVLKGYLVMPQTHSLTIFFVIPASHKLLSPFLIIFDNIFFILSDNSFFFFVLTCWLLTMHCDLRRHSSTPWVFGKHNYQNELWLNLIIPQISVEGSKRGAW